MTLTRMMMYGAQLYRGLAAETGVDPSWHEVGSVRLASSRARMEELERQAGWAKTFGLPIDLITPREAQATVPADERRGRPGRRLGPHLMTRLDPSGSCLRNALDGRRPQRRGRSFGAVRGSSASASISRARPHGARRGSPASTVEHDGEREQTSGRTWS